MNPEILSALRWIATLVGGVAVTKGLLTQDQATTAVAQLSDAVQAVTVAAGAVTALTTLLLGVWNANHQKHAKVQAAAEGIVLGTQIADPHDPATLSDAEPKVAQAVRDMTTMGQVE